MLQFFRTSLIILLLLMAIAPSAVARMVVGVTPAVTPGVGDHAVLQILEAELSSRLGETVQVRNFGGETAQIDWLIRFRELDAALISRGLLNTLPSGTLIQLADLPSAVVVTHPGIAAAQREALSRVFRSLPEDERGRQLLGQLAGTAKTAATSTTVPARRAEQSVVSGQSKPLAAAPVKSTLTIPKPMPAPSASKPVPVATSQPTAQSKAPDKAPPPSVAPAPIEPATTAQSPATDPVTSSIATSPFAKAQPETPAPVAPAAKKPTNSKRTRLLLLTALIILIGISVKVTLMLRHWEQKKRGADAPSQPPSAEAFEFQTSDTQPTPFSAPPHAPSTAATTPVREETQYPESDVTTREKVAPDFHTPAPTTVKDEPTPSSAEASHSRQPQAEPASGKRPIPKRKTVATKVAADTFPPLSDDLVVEQGRLGKIKVPALLKRCADLPQPVILRVRAGDIETCVHFAAGQICHADSRNWRIEERTRQWDKLGYLMVRNGLISEAQRDQALELIERQPELRFAAALQQLGVIDLETLRRILRRQATIVLFALILFSSGEYRIETDNGVIPAEESIVLRVGALIREASHHQAEWLAIRKALPNLKTRLDFTPDGHGKLEQVRLSIHQQLLLSQVDGQTPISALCSNSTMMDYEVCRFLYLMVKAGVLQNVSAV